MEGAYSLPLKFTPKWNWENTWGIGSLAALVLVPWTLASCTVPALLDVYRHVSTTAITWALIFGAAWGLGGVLLGLSIDMVGMSIGFSIILGIIAIDGSLIPLLLNNASKLFTRGGLWFLAAMAVLVLGIACCAVAGRRKEMAFAVEPRKTKKMRPFRLGLLLCIVSGLLCGCVNFALVFGTEVTHRAIEFGARPIFAANALWSLVFTANYLVNVGYCGYLVGRNGSAEKFFAKGTGGYWLQTIVMGIIWAAGIVVYGIGAYKMGEYGAFIGFPVMLATSILTANALGWLTGEWKGVPMRVSRIMLTGVGLLMLSISLLANADRLIAN